MDQNTVLIALTIDENLRTIAIPTNGVVFGVVGDVEVNRVQFVLPRYFRGFDLTEFTARVNYANPNGDANYYEADDITDTDGNCTFTWLMGSDVTAYVGDVTFSITLYKKEGDVVAHRFGTRPATGRVLEGYSVEESVTPAQQKTLVEKISEEVMLKVNQQSNILFKKDGGTIDIYMKSKTSDKYIHFSYQKVVNATINMNQWKVMDTDVCDKDLNILYNLYASTNNVEWEGVVKEYNTSDFIAGYHGDETNIYLSVFIDGREIAIDNDYTLTPCSEVMIVNKSLVNRCDTPEVKLFERYKVSMWNGDYIIKNRWITLVDNVRLSLIYMTMFSLPIVKGSYSIATHGRYDDKYIIQDPRANAEPGSCLYNSKVANCIEFWGDNFYGRCTGSNDKSKNDICYCDRSQSNIFKGYWRQGCSSDGYKTYNTNDEITGKSVYEFKF